MKKNMMFGFLVVMFILLSAYFAVGSLITAPWIGNFGTKAIGLSNHSQIAVNFSGTIYLNLTNYTSAGVPLGVNATHSNHLMNATFFWRLNRSGGEFVYNTTIFNESTNQSFGFINKTFNTSLLVDGVYNISINVTNSTGTINGTTVGPFTVDNTGPNVSASTNGDILYNLSSGNITFNASIRDLLYVGYVMFMFNGNTTQFNFTSPTVVENNSGNWGLTALDTATMVEGEHVMTVLANDTENNINQTQTVTFRVDRSAPNISARSPSDTPQYDASDGNVSFSAKFDDSISGVLNVSFNFNNGSLLGLTVFNVTSTNRSGGNCSSSIWNITYNMSLLRAGAHNISLIAQDYASNYNYTYVKNVIAFTVNTAPNVTVLSSPSSDLKTVSDGNLTFNISAMNSSLYGPLGINTSIGNVILMFNNASGVDFNFTVNTSIDSAVFGRYYNVSYNSSALRAGIQNVTVFVNDSMGNWNYSEYFSFTINTAPNVTVLSSPDSNLKTVADGNLTYNVSAMNSSRYGPLVSNTSIDNVILMFSNGTAPPYNHTVNKAVWNGRYYNISVNTTVLHAGTHTVTVFVNDSMGNWNYSEDFSFTLNTAPIVNLSHHIWGGNYSFSSENQTFNISARNSTLYGPLGINTSINWIILMFDNASGNAFNYTASVSAANGVYYNISYNVSQLKEGDHTVTVFVNDSMGNWNYTETFTFETDYTLPTPTLTRSSDSTTSKLVIDVASETNTKSCSVYPGGFSETTGVGSAAGTSRTIEYTGLSTGSTHDFTVTCEDWAGNSASVTESFTTDSTGDSASGTGGSGGGTSTGTKGETEQKAWASIFAGETATVDIANGEIGVSQVSFAVSETVYGPSVTIARKESFPSNVKDFEKKVYRNLRISKTTVLKDEYISNARIKFNVEKAWLTENGLGKNEIGLFRYVDDDWVELSTTFDGEDTGYLYYSAKTPGFSYFVIGEKEGSTAEEIAAEEEAAAAAEEAAIAERVEEALAKEKAKVGKGLVIFLLLAAIAVVAVVVYLRKRNQ